MPVHPRFHPSRRDMRSPGARRRSSRASWPPSPQASEAGACSFSTMPIASAKRSSSPAAAAATSPTSTARPSHFLSANPHFARSALARYTPRDFIALVERHRIPYHEKTLGQLFCDRSARDIVAMLEAECRAAGVRIILNQHITEIRQSDGFVVHTTTANYRAARSSSLPAASPFQRWAPPISRIASRRNSASPSSLPPRARSPYLAGRRQRALRGSHRTIHRGHRDAGQNALSREAALHAPRPQRACNPADFLLLAARRIHHHRPGAGAGLHRSASRAARQAAMPLPSELRCALFSRSASPIGGPHSTRHRLDQCGAAGSRRASASLADHARRQRRLRQSGGHGRRHLHRGALRPDHGKPPHPGLYFIGEAVDVTGHLGGYNFQWAWASGAAAGRAV